MIWPSSISSIRASSRARMGMGVAPSVCLVNFQWPVKSLAGAGLSGEKVLIPGEEARAHVFRGAEREQSRALGQGGGRARLRDRFEAHGEGREREVDDRADGRAAQEAETSAQRPVEPFEPG